MISRFLEKGPSHQLPRHPVQQEKAVPFSASISAPPDRFETANALLTKNSTVKRPSTSGGLIQNLRFSGIPLLFGAQPSENKPARHTTLKIKTDKDFATNLKKAAANLGVSLVDYLKIYMPHLIGAAPKKKILDGVTDTVIGSHHGKKTETKVTTLLGAKQIFDQWLKVLNQTEHYAQVAMYDFDNLEIEGGRPTDGADRAPGWKEQQQILKTIVEKARKGVRFQIILDNSVEREYDEFRNPIFPRKRNNYGIIEYFRKLKETENLPIDVVAYPRKLAKIYHVKALVSDGKRAILGGMNLSNHSPANWDACVYLEGPEVANIQYQTFHPDWVVARSYRDKNLKPSDIYAELPKIEPISNPAIQVLNTMPREYAALNELFPNLTLQGQEGIGDYLKNKFDQPDLKEVCSEQFIATHKALKEKMVRFHKSGRPIRMLHSAGVVDQFPYSRKTIYDLLRNGVPVRFYNEWQSTQEKLHAKWSVFINGKGRKNTYETLIGSANLSAAALETNISTGLRNDYTNHPEQRYTRGNRDMAVVIRSAKIAKAFIQQFNHDWEFSPPVFAPGIGQAEKAAGIAEVLFEKFKDKIQELLG